MNNDIDVFFKQYNKLKRKYDEYDENISKDNLLNTLKLLHGYHYIIISLIIN